MLTDRADIHAADTNEELLNFDISDDELERAAPIIGGVASRILLLASSAIAAAPSENSPSEMASLRRSPNWIKVKNPNAPGTKSSTRRPVCCIAATILTFQSTRAGARS